MFERTIRFGQVFVISATSHVGCQIQKSSKLENNHRHSYLFAIDRSLLVLNARDPARSEESVQGGVNARLHSTDPEPHRKSQDITP